MPGGLVDHRLALGLFFHAKQAAITHHDGGNGDIGLPNGALGEFGLFNSHRGIVSAEAVSVYAGQDSYNGRMAQIPENPQHQHEHGVAVAPAKPALARPPLYTVLLLNDDYTPMDFVVDVLVQYFSMGLEQATQVMLHVHTRGKGVCGVFTREIAETKVAMVNEYARLNQHPLLCTMEPA